MSCVEVRDRLAEYALGVLPPQQAGEVERHLEWCPGCQKEAEELRDGTAAISLSLPEAHPPAGLESRVVESVHRAGGRGKPASRRRGVRALAVAALAALVLAVGAMSWALAELHQARSARSQLIERVAAFQALFLKGPGSYQADLRPPVYRSSAQDEGRTLISSSPLLDDLIVVDAYFSRPGTGPYRFQLLDRSGTALSGGRLQQTGGGDWLAYESSGRDLSKGVQVNVVNGSGRLVLVGSVHVVPSG
jgi:hypothetical protein